MASADLVTSLRQAGVNRGDLVALVISPAFESGLATADDSWAVAPGAGIAGEVGRADEALRPRWVVWSRQTAARLAADGVRLATCWDITAAHRLLFGGWRADPGLVPGPGCTGWPPRRCRPTVRSTCSAWTKATPAIR